MWEIMQRDLNLFSGIILISIVFEQDVFELG